jgi:hypothetical protein
MIPKEKAKELVEKFKNDLFKQRGVTIYTEDAILCALIAVDGLIKYHESLYNEGFKDVHIALSSPIKTYNDILNPLLKYWKEVKQEIEKL